MNRYLMVALGGAIGALTRFIIGSFISEHTISSFPWATFIINITGCFIIGFFLTLNEQIILNPQWRFAIATGFVGAYTTFSTFEYEILKLVQQNKFTTGLLYAIASLIIGFVAVWGGMTSTQLLIGRPAAAPQTQINNADGRALTKDAKKLMEQK